MNENNKFEINEKELAILEKNTMALKKDNNDYEKGVQGLNKVCRGMVKKLGERFDKYSAMDELFVLKTPDMVLTETRQNSPSSRKKVSRWEMNGGATERSLFLFDIE